MYNVYGVEKRKKVSTLILFITLRWRQQSEMRVEKAESVQKRSRGWHSPGRAKNSVIFSLFIASNSTFPSPLPLTAIILFVPKLLCTQGSCRLQNGIPYIDYTTVSNITYSHTHTFVYIFHGFTNWNQPLIVPKRPV